MTAAGFLDHLRSLDIRLRVEDGKVRVSAPRGVLSPQLQAEIARRKVEILELISSDDAGAAGDPPIPQASRDSDLPLSFPQQRLWFLDQLEPGASDYTIAVHVPLPGPLDVPRLNEAVTELVRRHEVLRTTFPMVDGRPLQRIHDAWPVELHIVDLSALPAPELARVLGPTLTAEAKRPFDLAEGPLFRPILVRLPGDEHALLIAIHHMIADGWSLVLLTHELRAIHEGLAGDGRVALPELAVQYADYAAWQRERLTGARLERERSYWRERLDGAPPELELPADHPRGKGDHGAASHSVVFPSPVADALRQLARKEGATLFMVMLAAFDVLLARWTGQNDIVVGSPVANRTRPELENVIGFFANTLVLRTDVSGDPAFRALLARVRESCLGAYAHQEMPFEKLVEELQPERRMGRNPMFQISFVMQGEATGAGLSFVQVGSPFDVTVYVREAADGALGAAFEYRTDLFEPDTIDRLAAQYLHLVGAIVADPDLPVSKLPLLTADERERMLTLGSATASPYPRDASVHALFEERVDATPNAIAIRSDGAPISYIELDGRANRLAHHLLARGVAPDDVVGVCLERSVDAIIALIATLKVGAAFVPLDLLAPPARLGYVLRNAGVRIVLTHGATADKLPADAVELVRLDVDAEAIASNSAERPSIARTGDDLAYVMYTSGTTGDPKGVAVPHRGIVRLVRGTDYADFGADQVFLQYAPLSFDASTFEIWGALLNGGTLAIAPAGALSLDELDHVLEREGVTTLWLTAAVFHQAVLQRVDMFRGLRQLLAGGDVLSPRAVRTVREAWPDCRLINGYGPTENTTFSCCHPVQAHQELDRAVPIGSPIANSRVYVLDGRREPVPVGVPGELWLAGDGLALGYLGSPELTADRFVTHRFSDDRVERLYRTGDRARWLRDGTIEFMGRVDQQVKLRGFRIEPGEIEATLRRQPGVREAAVLVRGNGNVKRLLAYVTPHDLDAAALREAMRATLPEYMIPAAVVTLERLPTTANGKLDRAALPEPAMPADEASKVAPRNEVERLLVGLWEEVLEQPGIGVRDDFFALGGHSLMAVALFARIEQVLGVALPLATLFRSPTVEALARAITAGRRPSDERSLVPIRTDGHRPPLFAVPGVGGNVLCFHELAAQLPGDRPFFGLQSRGLVADQAPLDRIEEIASAYIAEVREVQPRGPYHLIGACMGGVIAYEMARQLRAEGEAVDLLGLLETWPPHYSMLVTLSASAVPARLTMAALRVTGAAQTLRQLDGGDRLRYVKSRLARVARVVTGRAARGGLSNNERINAVTRANKAAVASYRPEPYDGDAVLILAAERRIASAVDPRLSWRNLVRGRLDVLGVPGEDSGLMLRGDAVRILAERIQGCLDR